MVYNSWRERLLDTLLPVSCGLCLAPTGSATPLCADCLADLPRLGPACRRCARPLAVAGVRGACLRRPPTYDEALALYRYTPPLDQLVKQLKFSARLEYAPLFATALAASLIDLATPPDLILPVPLHRGRLWQRGYNQAWEIARRLAAVRGIPASATACHRHLATPPQSGLDARARRRNLRGAFRVTGRHLPRHVAVVDDVMTTGSTLEEIARLLKTAGVERVTALLVARALPPGQSCR